MRLFPFHAASTGLPELAQGTWRDLMLRSSSRSSAAGGATEGGGAERGIMTPDRQRTAGILLAEPHFIVVGFSTMLAVWHSGAWESDRREKVAGPARGGSQLVLSLHESCTPVLPCLSAVPCSA